MAPATEAAGTAFRAADHLRSGYHRRKWLSAWGERPTSRESGHTAPMAKLAKLGWMVAVTIHEGPSEYAVRCFVVGAETEAAAILAVRNSKGTGIDPADEIVLDHQLSQSEIEASS
jgi:hypothetical protein